MGFPPLLSPHGHVIDELFALAFWLTSVTGIIVIGIMIFCLIAFRDRPGRKAKFTYGNSKQALMVTLALVAFVFVGIDLNLAYHDFKAYEELFGEPPAESESLVIHVMAKQFEWNFRYAGNDGEFYTEDDVTTINQLNIPLNKTVLLQMQSNDVIHSLFPPFLRTKQDVVPGLTTMMWFEANRTSKEEQRLRNDPNFTFEIACAELCGLGHTTMRGRMEVMEDSEWIAWHKEESNFAPDMDAPEIWEFWKKPGEKYVPEPVVHGDDDDDDHEK